MADLDAIRKLANYIEEIARKHGDIRSQGIGKEWYTVAEAAAQIRGFCNYIIPAKASRRRGFVGLLWRRKGNTAK